MPNRICLVPPCEIIGISIGEFEEKYGLKITKYWIPESTEEMPIFKNKILKENYTIEIETKDPNYSKLKSKCLK